MARRELQMQMKICESYEHHGGYACKWDPAHAKGKPDLVCSLPYVGAHFIEVKHRPDAGSQSTIRNQLELRQKAEARKLIEAGALVFAGLIVGGGKTVADAELMLHDPLTDIWLLGGTKRAKWSTKNRFDVLELMNHMGCVK